MGPLEFLVIGFDGNNFSGEIVPELQSLRQRGIIRLLDLVFVKRDEDGDITYTELSEAPDGNLAAFHLDEGNADWFAEEDMQQIGQSLSDNSSVAMLLIEHSWAIGLQEAALRAKGSLLAEGFVPREVVEDVELLLKSRV